MARLDDLARDFINEHSFLAGFQSFQRSLFRYPSKFFILHRKAIELFTDRAGEGSVFWKSQKIELSMPARKPTWYRLSHIRLPSLALLPSLRFTFLSFVQHRACFAKCSHAILDARDILLSEYIGVVGEM